MRAHPDKEATHADTRGVEVSFGSFGLKALKYGRVTSNQIEAARKVMARYATKSGKVWIRIFPDKPVTKKPPEVTLGGGKGAVDHYVFPVRPGRIMFEMDGVTPEIAKEALRRAAAKLPVKTTIISV